MTTDLDTFRAHLRNFDPDSHTAALSEAEATRQKLVELFPRERWETMSLADYAQGDERYPDNYCVWMEHRSRAVGSIRGGNAAKHVIYRNRKTGWVYDRDRYDSEESAWEALRAGFLRLFEQGDAGEFERIDEIEALRRCGALTLKTAFVYYPDAFLPCYSRGHLCKFLADLGQPPARAERKKGVLLNRRLLSFLRELPESEGLSNVALAMALYEWNEPHEDKGGAVEELAEEQVEMLLERFRERMPGFKDFTSPGKHFEELERDYKHAILDRYRSELGNEKVREVVDSGQALEVVRHLARIDKGIVNFMSWRSSVGETEEAAGEVLRAFLDVAGRAYRGPSMLKPIIDAQKAHGLKHAWDTMSFVLWLMRPEDYFPIKIRFLRLLAEELGTPLPKGRPGTTNFARVLRFGRSIEQAIEHLEPNDWIDVQSFLWVVCPGTGYDEASPSPATEAVKTPTEGQEGTVAEDQTDYETDFPLNQILYGPPGTGKTYRTMATSVEIADGHCPDDRRELKARYDQLVEQSRIGFVTFHQSYTYEDFVEGIRPVMDEDTGEGAPRYECRDGIFKSMCQAAADRGSAASTAPIDFDGVRFWKMSLGNTLKAEDAAIYEDCIENGYICIGFHLALDISGCGDEDSIRQRMVEEFGEDPDVSSYRIGNRFKNSVSVGDIVIVTDGNRKFRAIGRVTGECEYRPGNVYPQARNVEWLRVFEDSLPADRLLRSKIFSQMTLYNLKPERLKLDALAEMLGTASGDEDRPYVLIIDEINRANISRVFGELITLLEADKRAGAEHGLSVTLPYSQESFAVPANLHIVGTMNTADKSIALVDVALRRRFVFEEILPDFATCPSLTPRMRAVLDELNHRITLRKDRDHRIGHSYFMKVSDTGSFDAVFRDSIAPLLQEYFYNDWDGLRFVLGETDSRSTIIVPLRGSDVTQARNRWCWYHEAGHPPVDFLTVLAANYGVDAAAPDASSAIDDAS